MVLIINLTVTAFLTGLIWFVQIVHYPLFAYNEKKSFIEYHIYHLKRTTYVVIAPMILEGVFSILLMFDYPAAVSEFVPFLCLCITTAVWLITFAKVVPLHEKLTNDGLNTEVIEEIVKMNWWRTILWSAKLLVLIYCLAKMIFVV